MRDAAQGWSAAAIAHGRPLNESAPGGKLEEECEPCMLLEIAKPIALILCLVSLYVVFYTAFFVPASDLEHRTWDTLALLSLSAGICMSSGMLFREPEESGARLLMRTLPVQVFLWAAGGMLILFLAS
jgi:hypothetical protein